MHGGLRRGWCRTGTRPGDPLADLVFALAFAEAQADVARALAAEGLDATLPLREGGVFADHTPQVVAVASPALEIPVLHPTFMDDTVLPVLASNCVELISRTQRTMEIVVSIFRLHGLEVNFCPGKTEALFLIHGPGAAEWPCDRSCG